MWTLCKKALVKQVCSCNLLWLEEWQPCPSRLLSAVSKHLFAMITYEQCTCCVEVCLKGQFGAALQELLYFKSFCSSLFCLVSSLSQPCEERCGWRCVSTLRDQVYLVSGLTFIACVRKGKKEYVTLSPVADKWRECFRRIFGSSNFW